MAKKKKRSTFRRSTLPGGGRQRFSSTQQVDGVDPILEGDDEIVNIVEVKEQAQDYFERNKGLVLGLLAALVLLVGGYLVWKYMIIAPKEKAAIEAMYQAETQFARDSFALALNNPGGGFDGFLDIIDGYSGTAAANTAKYYAGISYLNLGKFEAAKEYLSEYSPKDEITPQMKHGALGDVKAELGDLAGALSSYQKAASYENEFLTPYYLNKAALLSYKQGNMDEAKKAFQTIKDNYPLSQEARTVDAFISRLN